MRFYQHLIQTKLESEASDGRRRAATQRRDEASGGHARTEPTPGRAGPGAAEGRAAPESQGAAEDRGAAEGREAPESQIGAEARGASELGRPQGWIRYGERTAGGRAWSTGAGSIGASVRRLRVRGDKTISSSSSIRVWKRPLRMEGPL
jgi:hypothetical protein